MPSALYQSERFGARAPDCVSPIRVQRGRQKHQGGWPVNGGLHYNASCNTEIRSRHWPRALAAADRTRPLSHPTTFSSSLATCSCGLTMPVSCCGLPPCVILYTSASIFWITIWQRREAAQHGGAQSRRVPDARAAFHESDASRCVTGGAIIPDLLRYMR